MFSCTNISLIVEDECYSAMPEPMTKEKVIVTASPDTSSLKLVANFSGDTIEANYRIVWSNDSVADLLRNGLRDKYFTKRRKISDCAFTEELQIRNISEKNSGLYTARPRGYGNNGNGTSFEVIVESSHEEGVVFSLFYIIIIVIVPIIVALGVCIGAIFIYKKKKSSSRRCKCMYAHALLKSVILQVCPIFPFC